MEQAFLTKKLKKEQMLRLRNRYFSTIYKDLIYEKPIREIHKDIQRVTQIFNAKYDLRMPKLEKYTMKVASKVNHDIKLLVIPKIDIAEYCIQTFQKEKIYQNTKKPINELVNKIEAEEKEIAIKKELKANRKEIYPRVFYLASSHSDSAEDHINYQGKMYIDEKWESVIKDEEEKKKIRKYIRENNVKTLQWVMGKPVWFITRPNCRHYFKALDTFDVFSHNVRQLTRNHRLHTQIGKEEFKPISHPTNKQWYKMVNVQSIITAYQERLSYHLALYNSHKTYTLKNLITKDRMLLQKWKEYLTKLEK